MSAGPRDQAGAEPATGAEAAASGGCNDTAASGADAQADERERAYQAAMDQAKRQAEAEGPIKLELAAVDEDITAGSTVENAPEFQHGLESASGKDAGQADSSESAAATSGAPGGSATTTASQPEKDGGNEEEDGKGKEEEKNIEDGAEEKQKEQGSKQADQGLVQMIDQYKTMANKWFRARHYDRAVGLYSTCIMLDFSNHVVWSNRSAARLGLGENDLALYDADRVVDLKPDWAKGHYRRGRALFALKRYTEAVDAFERALELEPGSKELDMWLAETRVWAEQQQQGDDQSIGDQDCEEEYYDEDYYEEGEEEFYEGEEEYDEEEDEGEQDDQEEHRQDDVTGDAGNGSADAAQANS